MLFVLICFCFVLFLFILSLPIFFSRFIINLPEEERSSFERLGFQIEQAFWFYDDFYRPAHPHLPRLNLRTFGQTLMHRYPPLIAPFGGNFDQLYEEFITYKHAIPVCGAIILNESLTKVNSLGVFRDYSIITIFSVSSLRVGLQRQLGAFQKEKSVKTRTHSIVPFVKFTKKSATTSPTKSLQTLSLTQSPRLPIRKTLGSSSFLESLKRLNSLHKPERKLAKFNGIPSIPYPLNTDRTTRFTTLSIL